MVFLVARQQLKNKGPCSENTVPLFSPPAAHGLLSLSVLPSDNGGPRIKAVMLMVCCGEKMPICVSKPQQFVGHVAGEISGQREFGRIITMYPNDILSLPPVFLSLLSIISVGFLCR